MSSTILKELDISGSVLFLGSGFSRNALNIRNTNLPVGPELRNELAGLVGVNPNQYDLKTLADEVNSRPDLSLYQTLYQLFTVREIEKYQEDLLTHPWLRIYTTNYDDAIEFIHYRNNIQSNSFSYDDEKPKRLEKGTVIHLHGIIRKTTEDNVLHQLVLNELSYVRQHFDKSPWYDDFCRDLRFCSSCFFVGYSLSDYHITALLLQNPELRKKTYFVTNDTHDILFSNRIEPYGRILPIGVEGFAELCRTLPSPSFVSDPHALKAFRYLDPFKDKKTLEAPTPLEVLNLVAFGNFNYQRCLSTLPAANYVVPRQMLVNDAIEQLRDGRCLLVHSWLGNGKSLFLYILAHALSEMGYRCFFAAANPTTLQRDVDLLKSFGRTAIFFDWYYGADDIIKQLNGFLPDAKFIVAVRTAVHEARLNEITSQLPSPLRRINLNRHYPDGTAHTS